MYVLFAPILVPVALQNFSSAVILVAIITCMFFCISMDKRYFIVVLIVLALGAIPMILLKGYRSERLMNFWNPDTMDPSGQIMQGLYAIASGGLIGKGFGNSVQKLGNMPEVHTDMIFTIICEELGIIGGIMIIGLFLLILWRIFMIALKAPDLYGSLIAIGVFAQVAIQVVMNIAVVTNTIPATGVPLPFISYGGSNLLILMIEMGIVLSISNRTYEPIAEAEDE
jgi:cell division protein FtsW